MKFPIIETARLVLNQFTNDDLENVYAGLGNPEVIKYYGISFSSLEACSEQLRWFKDLEENNTGIWWAIRRKSDNSFCGAGGFNNMDIKNKKAEIGFWLLPNSWGNGFMQETMPIICKHAFEKLDLHRIEGFVESNNKNCIKAMNKLGFVLEGTMRDCEIKNQKLISVHVFSKLKTDEA